ncbi:hypothetical protein LCGC14_2786370 [marine sediment metagenome]|uniref:Uncharacterized protein n=1 Tax=marine sediment metagenome TaxID=412755 RepID=A0A0F8YRU3_9ZZZZ
MINVAAINELWAERFRGDARRIVNRRAWLHGLSIGFDSSWDYTRDRLVDVGRLNLENCGA